MDSLQSILKYSHPSEPPQIKALRDYIKNKYSIEVAVSTSNLNYCIVVPNGMIATTIRMDIPNIKRDCNLDKRLVIQIGRTRQ